MVDRTSRLLQLLHSPPSLAPVVVVEDTLRLAARSVKSGTTTSCGGRTEPHNRSRKLPVFSKLLTGYRRSDSAIFPPLFHRFSAGNRQVIHRVLHRADLSVSSENPLVFRRFCYWFSYSFSSTGRRTFSSTFWWWFTQDSGGRSRKIFQARRLDRLRLRKSEGRGRADHYGWWLWRRCTHNVARGTFRPAPPGS